MYIIHRGLLLWHSSFGRWSLASPVPAMDHPLSCPPYLQLQRGGRYQAFSARQVAKLVAAAVKQLVVMKGREV